MIRVAIFALTFVLAGCAAATPTYLCLGGRMEDGTPAMVCQPVPEGGGGK